MVEDTHELSPKASQVACYGIKRWTVDTTAESSASDCIIPAYVAHASCRRH